MKLYLIVLTIALYLIAGILRADACERNVMYVPKGTEVKCDTWLVKDSQMQEFAKTSDKLELSQKLIEQQKQLIKLNNEEIEFYKVQSQSRSKELNKAETRRFYSNVGYFVLGVVITGFATKVAIEASR